MGRIVTRGVLSSTWLLKLRLECGVFIFWCPANRFLSHGQRLWEAEMPSPSLKFQTGQSIVKGEPFETPQPRMRSKTRSTDLVWENATASGEGTLSPLAGSGVPRSFAEVAAEWRCRRKLCERRRMKTRFDFGFGFGFGFELEFQIPRFPPNPKFEIQNSKFKLQNLNCEIQNSKSPNPKFEFRNSELSCNFLVICWDS